MRTSKEVKRDVFKKRPNVKTEYENMRPQYELITRIIEARNEEGISQKELAERTGIARSNISRLESGNYNPSFEFIAKVAKGLGREIHVEFRKPESSAQHATAH